MEFDQQERGLIKILADEWEKSGPPGYVETSKIAAHLEISIADAIAVVKKTFRLRKVFLLQPLMPPSF